MPQPLRDCVGPCFDDTSCTAPDAGTPLDAGVDAATPPSDAGSAPDAGTARDAGFDSGLGDAYHSRYGCCSVAGVGPARAAWCVVAVVLFGLVARRRAKQR